MATEILECDATGSPDQWTNQGGANKVVSVSDGVDANYVFESVDEERQRFTLANSTDINESDTINTVSTMWRAQDTGSGNNRVHAHQFVGAESNDSGEISLDTSWTDYQNDFDLAPDATSWTLTDLNNLQLEVHCSAIGASREVQVTRLYVSIDYTPVSAAKSQFIIIS
jgi:hypothetical protein